MATNAAPSGGVQEVPTEQRDKHQRLPSLQLGRLRRAELRRHRLAVTQPRPAAVANHLLTRAVAVAPARMSSGSLRLA